MEATDGGGGSSVKSGDGQIPLDAEAKALKLEQTKAESRKAIAQAEQAVAEADQKALLAKLPSGDIKPLEGKIDVGDKSGLPADLLAHSLVTNAAKLIAEATSQQLGAGARVLLVDDRHLANADWPYIAVRRQLTQQKQSIETALQVMEGEVPSLRTQVPTGVQFELDALESMQRLTGTAAAALGVLPILGSVATAAPAAVTAVAAVAAMFHSDYSITSRDSSITTTPLLSAVAGVVLEQGCEVTIAGFHLVRESAMSNDFWDSWNRRVRLEQLKLQISTRDIAPAEQEIAALQKRLDAAVAEHGQLLGTSTETEAARAEDLNNLDTETRRLEDAIATRQVGIASKKAAVAVADAALRRFDAFVTAVTTTSGDASYPPLVAAAIQERLRVDEATTVTSGEHFTHVLYVAVEAAGGETISRRNIFLGSRLSYTGGAQFSYLLLDTGANRTVAAGSNALLASLKYGLFWSPTGPHDLQVKILKRPELSGSGATRGQHDPPKPAKTVGD